MLQIQFAIALHQATPMTVIRLFDAQPDMHITDCTLLGGSPFAPRPPRDIKAALLIYSAPLSLLSIVSYYADFVNMLLCCFRRIYCTRAPPLWLFCHILVDIVSKTCYNRKYRWPQSDIDRKGVWRLSIIFNFVFSVIAGIYSYYICKWLDGEK